MGNHVTNFARTIIPHAWCRNHQNWEIILRDAAQVPLPICRGARRLCRFRCRFIHLPRMSAPLRQYCGVSCLKDRLSDLELPRFFIPRPLVCHPSRMAIHCAILQQQFFSRAAWKVETILNKTTYNIVCIWMISHSYSKESFWIHNLAGLLNWLDCINIWRHHSSHSGTHTGMRILSSFSD